jgi:hypothetical protein
MSPMMTLGVIHGPDVHGQCNPDIGPGDNIVQHGPGGGFSMTGKQCNITGYASGTKCFPMGLAAACNTPTQITNGQSYSVEASLEVQGVGVKVGSTFTADQAFGPVGGAGMKCRFWICYANCNIFNWHCTRTFIFSWDNSYVNFKPGLATVTACCAACLPPDDGEPPREPPPGSPEVGPQARSSINIDLTTHFTPFALPPPGHPLTLPHEFFGLLTQWHLCQIQAASDIAGWEGGPGIEPNEEIVIFDIDGTGHHFTLDVNPFPFWPGLTPQLTQNSSLTVTPGVGVACFDEVTGFTLGTSVARSYDLGTIPATAGYPYTINGVVSGIDSNSGTDIIATVNVYVDSNGGAPGSPGTDLVLLASAPLMIPHSLTPLRLTAAFPAPVTVPPGSTIVAELDLPPHPNGTLYPGGNTAAQAGPTYFLSASCAVPMYVDLATLGFPASHFVQVIVGTPELPPCPANIVTTGASATRVDVDDLLAVISGWGPCPPPCPPFCAADVNDNCVVNVDDLLAVIASWGPC